MAITNSIVQKQNGENNATISKYLGNDDVKKWLVSSLGTEAARQNFTSNIVACVSANPDLQKCDFPSIVSAGLLATSLKLSMSPSLGLCYIVPYEDYKNKRSVGTFILSYKGYIQLAIRSGYYKAINVTEIKKGEYLGRDAETGDPRFKFIEDDETRDALPTIGYMAHFEYLNGFRKVLYWSKEKMISHADTYSKAFSKDAVKSQYPNKCKVSFADYEAGKYPKDEEWKYSSPWYRLFDDMAKKTMIRQLISKWGIMSIDMQTAYEKDSENSAKEEMFDVSDSAEDGFFGNPAGLDSPGVTDAEEKIVPKSARKKKTDAEVADADGFFGAE